MKLLVNYDGADLLRSGRLVAGLAVSVLAFLLSWAVPSVRSQSTVILGTDGAAQGHSVELPLWLENSAQFAGLQVDLLINPLFVDTDKMSNTNVSITSTLANVLVDGGMVAPDRYRVVLLSTDRVPLPSGEAARITFTARTNSPNGLLRVLLGKPPGPGPGADAVSVTTNGACASGLDFQAGQFLVGDAFGFVDGVGRVQFRAVDGATNVFLASTDLKTNLSTWLVIGTNIGLDELVIWMDRDVTNYTYRFYHAEEP